MRNYRATSDDMPPSRNEECATMRLTIDGVNLSDLSPFPILDTVVFLRFATGTADEDVYEGPCSLDTIED